MKNTVISRSWLGKMIRYRPFSFAVMGIMPLLNSVYLITGLLIQDFFNHLQADTLSHQTHFDLATWSILILYMLAFLLGCAFLYGTYMTSRKTFFTITSLIQYNLFEHILRQSEASAVPESAGAAISTFRDDPPLVLSLLPLIATVVFQAIYGIVAAIILVRVNAVITLLVCLPLASCILFVQTLRQHLTKFRQASRHATSDLTGAIGEIFGAVQAIQVAGAESHVVAHIEALNEKRRLAMVKDTLLTDLLNTGMYGLTGVATGLILMGAALQVHSSPLHAGDLALFITYLGLITSSITVLGLFRAASTQTRVSLERLTTLMHNAPVGELLAQKQLYLRGEEPPLPVPARKSPEHRLECLEVNNLTYHYPQTQRGIEGIHLRLSQGTVTVITGRVGSGKSTCLQVLQGLLPYERGEIYWNGQCVDNPATFFVPPRSAYTPQTPHLFSETLKENVLLGLVENEMDLERAIYLAALDRDVMTLAQGLETVIGTHGTKLSGGQIQRAAAARMLVRDSELLIFDDLSSALDVETEQRLWNRFFSQEKRPTCLVVSHRRQVLQMADQIVVLKHGKIDAIGNAESLLATNKEFQSLWYGTFEQPLLMDG